MMAAGGPIGAGEVDHERAGQPGADEVGEVETADALGPAAEEGGDDHARRHEGDEDEQADGEELPMLLADPHVP